MRQIIFNAYTWDEASDELKKKILKKNWDLNVDDNYWWADEVIDNFKYEDAKEWAKGMQIYFDIAGGQGSGLCFICDAIDVIALDKNHPELFNKHLKKYLQKYQDDFYPSVVKRNYHYEHENTCVVEGHGSYCYGEYRKIEEAAFEKIEKILEKERLRLSCKLYKDLDKLYFYLLSDEAIIENIEANGYDFFDDGRIAGE